ncbi:hypothetical protein GCM10027030_08610 [Luteococcus sediminum]
MGQSGLWLRNLDQGRPITGCLTALQLPGRGLGTNPLGQLSDGTQASNEVTRLEL